MKLFKGQQVISLKEFERAFEKSTTKPVRERSASPVTSLIIITLILLAVNMLSGAHTIPIIQQFYTFENPQLLKLVGYMGFVGIEGTIVFFMSRHTRGVWEWVAIMLALITALASNLYSTSIAVDQKALSALIGYVMGVFAPMANLAIGEVYHKLSIERARDLATKEKTYREALENYYRRRNQAYRQHLSRVGIKAEADKMALLSGIDVEVANSLVLPEPEIKVAPDNKTPKINAQELAERMKVDDTQNKTYKELRELYGVSPNTIAKAKKLI